MEEDNQFKFTPSVWIVPAFFLIVMWAVFFIELKFNFDFALHGIYPRKISGLQGILFSPFIHGDFHHLINNSVPILFLIAALIYFYRNLSLKIIFYGIILSGLLTWIIARPSYHIGASSLIYVMVSFMFFKGIFTKYYRLTALSLVIVFYYGGMIWYVFPEIDNKISWEGHLSGFVAGLIFSIFYKTPDYKKEIRYEWEKPDFNPEEDMFMKHFDDNGNFVNTPIEDEVEKDSAINSTVDVKIIYEYKKDEKQ